MGVRTSLATTTLGAGHVAAAFTAGHNPLALNAQVQFQLNDAIQALKQLVKTMPGGDPNIAGVNALIASLS